MSVNYYLEKRTDKQGDAPIRLSVAVCGARFITSTGYKIAPNKWNSAKQQVKQGSTNAQGITYNTINARLSNIRDFFAGYENQCITAGKRPTKADLHREFATMFKAAKSNQEQGFWSCWAQFINEMGAQNEWTNATIQKFNALKVHLQAWEDSVTFDEFNEAGLNNFVAYLREVCRMRNTTIGKQLGFLKWFLRWANSKGYNKERAFATFAPRLKTAPKQVIFLDWQELMRVYEYQIPPNGTKVILTRADGTQYEKVIHDAAALKKTKDLFCFCCFTSLRYSDAANLKRSNISNNAIILTTIKTADTLKIDLNKYALSILDKYKNEELPGGKVFPAITNQRMNVYLKELCELCEINQPITQTYYIGNTRYEETMPKYELIGTHTGRRTFICNALMLGISPQVVMKWTGHSDYKSMKPYIDVTDAAKADAMKLFDNL